MSNILAIVGRPNVGKSTLFNRLVGQRQAIVDSVSGVTRDRHYGKSEWNGIQFSVIDTGGYIKDSEDVFQTEISKQVHLAIDEADVIILLMDIIEGLNPLDVDVANILRRSKKPVVLSCNKTDSNARYFDTAEFYSLGLGEVFPISAMTGSGTGELLDEVVKYFKDNGEEDEVNLPRFAVVGRPNVGKSSIVNAFLGTDRNIVTPVAGTTRDSIYTRYNYFGFDFYLVDTAGVRKKSKVEEDLEFYSVMRSIRSIENCDVCIVMIDATSGMESQDLNIFGLAQRNNKGIVLVVNKWDLVEKGNNTHLEYKNAILDRIAPFTDVPIIFTSVITKQRIYNVVDTAVKVYNNKTKKISTSKLNEVLLPIVKETPPPMWKGKQVKIKYITQLKKDYPVFVFFCNLPQYVKDPYKRFVENRIRELFDFNGVPITLYFREK
ncbi:MAG: ribosome biogenesis GTPase Der [Bacteroidales bacterium]|jgi:GTPase|nr:ribosome biogenesis GTPase Der [Bacteroidales bacterium]MDD3152887.1 ribosome biogenesis GTPase Der [Bacteroidales bacterium]MDD3914693.1 ribosome biogenesis GTPase Der [Bacteroidales bacterium]MDD4634553.1 ribosome biogenesis GTPase Der [Bacteroidales bacterium]